MLKTDPLHGDAIEPELEPTVDMATRLFTNPTGSLIEQFDSGRSLNEEISKRNPELDALWSGDTSRGARAKSLCICAVPSSAEHTTCANAPLRHNGPSSPPFLQKLAMICILESLLASASS